MPCRSVGTGRFGPHFLHVLADGTVSAEVAHAGDVAQRAFRPGGGLLKQRAHLGLAIKVLGLTTGDAYEVFPPPTCTAETQACLAALPATATDLSSCGEAVLVRACPR